MSINNSTHPVSKPVKQERAKIAGWVLPASVVAFLGMFFSIYFLPFGLILFLIAVLIVGVNLLRKE